MPARNERQSEISAEAGIVTVEQSPNRPGMIDAEILYGLPAFDEQRSAAEIVNLRRQGAQIVVEIGRRLLQAHGHYAFQGGGGAASGGEGFRTFCGRAGVSKSAAYNYIRVVRRLAENGLLDAGSTPLVRIDAGVTKLLTIVELDPEDLRALSDGDQIELGDRRVDLDEVDRMTTAELRSALRDSREAQKRAADRVRTAEDREKNAEAAAAEERRKATSNGLAPTDVEVLFAGVMATAIRWGKEVQDRPRAEREAAYTGCLRMSDQIVRTVQQALAWEKLGMDAPVIEDEGGD